MSDTVENAGSESLLDKNQEKIQPHEDSSSSSDSDGEKPPVAPQKKRLFGRQQPVHVVFGAGKPADIILWRNRQMTAGVLVGFTALWFIFEYLGYHLLTFMCHVLILSLGLLFIWSNISVAIHKPPPKFPEIILPEDLFVSIAHSVRYEINRAFATLRQIASGKDLKKFLMGITGLWVVSVIGSWFNFLTLAYIVFVVLHTVPVLYEKHEDRVDSFAERALAELNKQYAVLDEKVLKKISWGLFKGKKQQ